VVISTEEITHMYEQPDPVCTCGKTSEGVCPRCGQDMGGPNVSSEQEHKPYRIRRKDGLYYRGPFYKNVFTPSGKRYKTLEQAELLRSDLITWANYMIADLQVTDD
jgi:hypothetical protein